MILPDAAAMADKIMANWAKGDVRPCLEQVCIADDNATRAVFYCMLPEGHDGQHETGGGNPDHRLTWARDTIQPAGRNSD